MIKIKIKKLVSEAVIPSYSHDSDGAMDLTAIGMEETDKFIEYKTGLAIEIPKGFVGLIFPRSSVSKKDLILANSVGVVDSGYRGEFLARFQKLGKDIYEIGERIAQLMIIQIPKVEIEVVDELSETSRGESGFGSSGL